MFYAEQVARISGLRSSASTSRTGSASARRSGSVEFEAYYRRVRERFLAALEDEPETYGWPCGHCGICDFRHMCWQQRVDDDHLTLVAGMRRMQAETLMTAGSTRSKQLGDLSTRHDG